MHKSTRIIPYIVLGWWLWAISANLQAVEVAGLYEAELVVSSQGRAERRKVIRSALAEVLIKISGNGQVALSPGIPKILGRSSQYLQQYRYRNAKLAVNAVTGIAPTQQYLWVRFDHVALDIALREIGLPIWGRSRPVTLVWLVIEQAGQRDLLTSSDDSTISYAIVKHFQRRGIPLVLPIYDLEDQQQVRVTDVLGGFHEQIIAASTRYGTDAVLVGHLRDIGNDRWQGRWTLHLDGQQSRWTEQGNFDAALSFGIDGVASNLASNFVRTTTNNPSELTVLITNVFNLEGYARSDRFLAGLDDVIRVQPDKIDGEQILFKIKLRGDSQSLLQSVRLSSQNILALVKQEVMPIIRQPLLLDNVSIVPDITFRLLP